MFASLVSLDSFVSLAAAVYCGGTTAASEAGGAEEARTPDPLLAKEVLSQLSYGPWRLVSGGALAAIALTGSGRMVGHSGLEPETSVLSGLRSNQLS